MLVYRGFPARGSWPHWPCMVSVLGAQGRCRRSSSREMWVDSVLAAGPVSTEDDVVCTTLSVNGCIGAIVAHRLAGF